MKELICIICPRGCHLEVDEETLSVSGNACPRGAEYGKNEISCPVRTITGTVSISGGIHPRLPVRTDVAVPKSKMFEIMDVLHTFKIEAPVKRGQVLITNICETDANVIATRNM